MTTKPVQQSAERDGADKRNHDGVPTLALPLRSARASRAVQSRDDRSHGREGKRGGVRRKEVLQGRGAEPLELCDHAPMSPHRPRHARECERDDECLPARRSIQDTSSLSVSHPSAPRSSPQAHLSSGSLSMGHAHKHSRDPFPDMLRAAEGSRLSASFSSPQRLYVPEPAAEPMTSWGLARSPAVQPQRLCAESPEAEPPPRSDRLTDGFVKRRLDHMEPSEVPPVPPLKPLAQMAPNSVPIEPVAQSVPHSLPLEPVARSAPDILVGHVGASNLDVVSAEQFQAVYPEAEELSISLGNVQRTMSINNSRLEDELRTLQLQREVLQASPAPKPQGVVFREATPQRPSAPQQGPRRPRVSRSVSPQPPAPSAVAGAQRGTSTASRGRPGLSRAQSVPSVVRGDEAQAVGSEASGTKIAFLHPEVIPQAPVPMAFGATRSEGGGSRAPRRSGLSEKVSSRSEGRMAQVRASHHLLRSSG